MQLSNNFIYENAYKLYNLFNNNEQYIPIRLNFILRKNIQTLMNYMEQINEGRQAIGMQYGIPTEDGGFNVPTDKIDEANKELIDLGNIVQEVPIQTIKFNEIDENIKLTPQQMEAIMFMIEE